MKTLMSSLGLMMLQLLLALSPLACGEEFDPAARVTDFRLIAVRADKPYAAPGERVELTTLFHEPFGRPITWAWATCVRPADTTVNGCITKLAADAQATGQPPSITQGKDLSTFATTIPANILDGVAAGAAQNVLVGVVTVACPGTLSIGQGEQPFRCVDANTHEDLGFDRFVVSVKRIYVRRTERNQNPVLTGVTWDGQPWAENEVKEVKACSNDPVLAIKDCDGGEEHELSVIVPPGTAESGTAESGAAFAEDVVAQYLGTEGLFEFEGRTLEKPATKWAARAAAAGREQTLFFVVRENRGGVTWTTRRVRVK